MTTEFERTVDDFCDHGFPLIRISFQGDTEIILETANRSFPLQVQNLTNQELAILTHPKATELFGEIFECGRHIWRGLFWRKDWPTFEPYSGHPNETPDDLRFPIHLWSSLSPQQKSFELQHFVGFTFSCLPCATNCLPGLEFSERSYRDWIGLRFS